MRRAHGEGSIYQRSDGRWVGSFRMENGKRKYLYGKNKRDVVEKLRRALSAQQQGMLATGKNQKLSAYLNQWLDEVKKPVLKPLSYRVYRQALNNHILPKLGHISLQALTAQQVQQLYNDLGKTLAPRTIHRIHALLEDALEQAVKWNLVARNVCKFVQKPRAERYQYQVLSAEQSRHLLEVARGNWMEPILWVALTTAMRKGEILGLHWGDIHFEEQWLLVNRTVARAGRSGMQISTPKTEGSRRMIALIDLTVALLLRKLQEGTSSVIVFSDRKGGYRSDTSINHALTRLLASAGLPAIRFHDLRHSAASLLLGLGVPAKVVSEILGHSTIKLTMDTYSHVSLEMQREAMEKLRSVFR